MEELKKGDICECWDYDYKLRKLFVFTGKYRKTGEPIFSQYSDPNQDGFSIFRNIKITGVNINDLPF